MRKMIRDFSPDFLLEETFQDFAKSKIIKKLKLKYNLFGYLDDYNLEVLFYHYFEKNYVLKIGENSLSFPANYGIFSSFSASDENEVILNVDKMNDNDKLLVIFSEFFKKNIKEIYFYKNEKNKIIVCFYESER